MIDSSNNNTMVQVTNDTITYTEGKKTTSCFAGACRKICTKENITPFIVTGLLGTACALAGCYTGYIATAPRDYDPELMISMKTDEYVNILKTACAVAAGATCAFITLLAPCVLKCRDIHVADENARFQG